MTQAEVDALAFDVDPDDPTEWGLFKRWYELRLRTDSLNGGGARFDKAMTPDRLQWELRLLRIARIRHW